MCEQADRRVDALGVPGSYGGVTFVFFPAQVTIEMPDKIDSRIPVMGQLVAGPREDYYCGMQRSLSVLNGIFFATDERRANSLCGT